MGKRSVFEVVVERINSFDRPAFGYGRMETVWVVTMREIASGAAIVSKSPAFRREKGARLTIKATVKEHSEYRGELQTIVQRVAVQKETTEAAAAA